jgi:hypothetical protein
MSHHRPIMTALVLGITGVLAVAGKVNAGPISGAVHELDGSGEVTDFTIEVFKGLTMNPASISNLVISGNSYSFTVLGGALPAGNKTVRIEFVRGNTRTVVKNVNGNIAAAQVINVTIGPRTAVTQEEHHEVSSCPPKQRHRLFARRGLFRCR